MQLLPTRADALYRLFRLRRLIVISALLPVLTALAFGRVSPEALPWLGGAMLIVFALHCVIFPIVWMETLSISLALCVVIGLFSWDLAEIGVSNLIAAPLMLLALGMLLQNLLGSIIELGPTIRRDLSAKTLIRCDVATARASIPPSPDQAIGRRTCGPEDASGNFRITQSSLDIDMAAGQASTRPFEMSAVIVEDEPLTQTTLACLEEHDIEGSLCTYMFQDHPKGCVVGVAEPGNEMTFGMALGFWLQDLMGDHLTEWKDRLEDRPVRAICCAHMWSLLVIAGCYMTPCADRTGEDGL